VKPVNLLPESQRRRRPRQSDGKSAYVVLGVLGALLAMSGLYVVTSNQVTSRTDAAAAASTEADRLEAQVARLGSFADFAQIKQARVASVRQLATDRFDWERLMLEVARVLPSNGWLQSVEASSTGLDAGAVAAAPSGGPAATFSGCLPRHSDVADLMLRLGRMHRVEDVTLTESGVEDELGAPSVDGCGHYRHFEIGVTFAAALSGEAPDGERRVPASLGGGS
jgi:Tfp pilus assembly protein PilN